MKAVVIREPGAPAVLELREVATPPCAPCELLVEVRAAGLNRADLLQRRGLYPAPPGVPPDVPGLEFAGEVREVGAQVLGFRRGDRVMGLLGGGACAELVAADHRLCMRLPPETPYEEAAAIPEAFLTAFDALLLRAGLGAGEALLVHAAASGVGTAAVQLGAVAGARVVAASRSAERREALRRLGVGAVVDASSTHAEHEVLAAAGGAIDVVLGLVGASTLALDLQVLRPRGRLLVVGLLGGARAEVDLGIVLRKRLSLLGCVLRSRALEEKIDLVRRFSERILPLLAAGRVRAVVDRVLPLERVAEAHGVMERGEHVGKIVLRVGA